MLWSPFRRSQQKTLAWGIAALAEVAHATSFAVAGHLAGELGSQLGRALHRFYRRLRHARLEAQLLTAPWRQLLGQRQELLLALAWTEGHHDLRLLVAAVVVGGRAMPVQTAAFSRTPMPRSQPLRESTVVPLSVHTLQVLEQAAVLLGDRGFRRTSGRRHGQERRQAVVVRLVPDVLLTTGSSGGRLFRHWPRAPGQAVALGWGLLRQARAVRVRLVGVWAPGPREPWWWATALAAPLAELVALDDRRMTSEEPCRDTKGGRCGVRLEGTPCRTPADLARLTLLVGVALVRWTAVGQAVAKAAPRFRLPCKRQGPRLSRLRVGLPCVATLAWRLSIGVRFIRTHLPPPRLRRFPWLPTIAVVSWKC
jgi:hypothetical protein